MRPWKTLCSLLLTLTVAVPALAQNPPERFFGAIAPGHPQGDLSWHAATFDSISSVGAKVVRVAMFWNYNSGVYPHYFYNSWDTQQALAGAQARGLGAYGILNPPNQPSSPPWTPPSIDAHLYQTFLRFSEDMAYYHGGQIEYWEVGNEVNLSFEGLSTFYPGWDFARLLRDTRAALRRGFQRRSDYAALVAARGGEGFKMYPAGTAGTDLVWIRDTCLGLESLYDQYPSEGRYVEGFSIHPFSAPGGPDDRTFFNAPGYPYTPISHGTLLQNLEWAHFTLAANCPRVPRELFIGEYGWSTSYPEVPAQAVSESAQAAFFAQGLIEAHASGKLSRAIHAWTFRDLPHHTWDYWDHTGLLREDGSQKPAWTAIRHLITRLTGLGFRQNLGWLMPVGRMYLYGGANRQTLVYWNPTSLSMTVKATAGSTIRVYDHLGNQTQAPPAGATQVSVTVFPEPRYVEVTGGRITTVLGQSLDANGVPTLPGYTTVPTTWTRASSTLGGSPSGNAFDGSSGTVWNSGGLAPGWVEAKLYNLQNVRALVLEPSMMPSGLVDHKVELAINNGAYQQVAQVTSYLSDDMKVVVKLPQTYTNVSHVRVRSVARTDGSPTWLAWREVRIYQ
ncbi:MAG TPA: hypothetical protein VF017_17230 [Thermoanaerobaculia bacterium]|nr:hypothetical protein [Thermoanaerobaculia bacterium]